MTSSPIHCPRCTSPKYRRSRSGWVRHLTRFLCVYPFRCRRCDARFWRFAPFAPTCHGPKRKRKVAEAPAPPPVPELVTP